MRVPARSEADRVIIFDTTLRDGEQSPGATMTHEEKLEVAEVLDAMGVDVIEAGFPIASEGDFAAVHDIAQRTRNAVVCGLARAGHKDIDRAGEAIKPAQRGRIHTFISTSPVHMKWKLQMEPEKVYEMVISSVTRARNFTDDVEWSCEDGTRSEHDFLCRCIEAAIKAGATTINIPDTRRGSRPIAIMTSAWQSRTRLQEYVQAFGRSNAPSTASANAPVTPRSKRW
jgi:2-isopropylmalate synthase